MNKNKKGFTIIELLAVIVVLGLIILVAIPAINRELGNFRNKYYVELEKTVKAAGQDYIGDKRFAKPTKLLNTKIIKASDLSSLNYMDPIKDYRGHECDNTDTSYSYVVVVKLGEKKYEYQTCLKCSDDEYVTDTTNQQYDLCNPAWLNNEHITYNGLSGGSDDILWVYYGTSAEAIERQVGLTYGVVKTDGKGHELASVSEAGSGKAKIIYPDNINELVDANLDTVVDLVYTLPSGETVTRKAKMYRYGVPKINITYTEGNAFTGKAAGASYGSGANEWANHLTIRVSYAEDDLNKYAEVIAQHGIKRIEYQIGNSGNWYPIESCNSSNGGTCVWDLNSVFDKNIKIRIVDDQGNASMETPLRTIKVDSVKPTAEIVVTHSGELVGGIFNGDVTVTLNTNDTGGSPSYKKGLTTSSTPTYNNVTEIVLHEDTNTTYYGYVMDAAGNTSQDSKAVIRDTTPPVVRVTMMRCQDPDAKTGCGTVSNAGHTTAWYLRGMRYEIFVVEDNMDRIEIYQNNAGTFSSNPAVSSTPTSVIPDTLTTYASVTGGGKRRIKIVAIDKVGQKTTVEYTLNISKVFTITLNKDGGSGGTDKIYEAYGIGFASTEANAKNGVYYAGNTGLTVPTKNHYDFDGYYDSSSAGTKYFNGTGKITTNADTTRFDSNDTLYGRWTPKNYTLTYNSNGGTACSPATITKAYNVAWGVACTPTKTGGYKFEGWHDTTESGSTINASTKATKDVTAMAKWLKTYDIIYNINGGDGGTVANSTCVVNTDCVVKANSYTKTGYQFSHWNTKANGTGTTYYPDNKITLTNKNITLYAIWEPNSVRITLDDNGGSGGSGSKTAVYGQDMPQTTPPSKASNTFTGYTKNKNGTGTRYYNHLGKSAHVSDFASAATIYAQWCANCVKPTNGDCQTTVNNNGTCSYSATCATGYTVSNGTTQTATCTPNTFTFVYKKNNTSATGTMSNTTCTYDQACNLRNINFSLSGYTFQGWATTSTGAVVYGNQANVKNKYTSGSHNIYAVWAKNYTLSYDGNGNTGGSTAATTCVSGQACTIRTNGFTKSGHTFAGWNTKANGSGTNYSNNGSITITANTTLYAKWTVNTYTLTYNNNSGSGCTSKTGTYGSTWGALCTPTRSGYTFVKWNTKSDGSGSNITSSTTVSGNLTVYAIWAKNYTLSFNGNGNTGGSTASKTCASGISCSITSNGFTKTGHAFAGWNTKANGTGTNYSNNGSITITADTTLYAKWTANTYTLTYNNNSGSGCTSKTGTYGSTWGTLCTPTRSGYTFVKWNTKSDGSGSNITSSTTVSGNLTVYAIWAKNYTLSFNGNGNTGGSTASKTCASGISCSITSNGFTKTGHAFAGWNTKANGTGTNYSNNGSITITADTTLYAKWTANTYTLTYNNNSGSGCTSKTGTYGSTWGTLCTPTRSSYTFKRWNTKSDGSGTNVTSSTTVSGNSTVYAIWELSCALVTPINNASNPQFCWTLATTLFGSGAEYDKYLYLCKSTDKSTCVKATNAMCQQIPNQWPYYSYYSPIKCN